VDLLSYTYSYKLTSSQDEIAPSSSCSSDLLGCGGQR